MATKIQQVTLSPSYQAPPVTADYAEVSFIGVPIGKDSASGTVNLGIMVDDEFVVCGGGMTVAMTGEQYKAWGTNDTYAVDCLIDNAGLVRV